MVYLLGFGLTVAVFTYLAITKNPGFFAGTVLFGIGLLMSTASLSNRILVNAEIQKFIAVEATVNDSRSAGNIEDAALKVKIAEMNEWLAESKFYKHHYGLDIYWPDEIDVLQPIK